MNEESRGRKAVPWRPASRGGDGPRRRKQCLRMEGENVKLSGLLRDKYVLVLLILVFISSTVVSIFISLLVGALLITTLCTGLLLPYIIFRDGKQIPNLLALFTGSESSNAQGEMPRSCSVCGGERCQRQHPSAAIPLSIHAHVTCTVPQSVDEALEELLTMVLDNYVYTWYQEISVHDQLSDEIRYLIRYAMAGLATKLTKVDLTMVITDRLLPALINHLDAYVEGSRRVRGNISLEATVVQYLRAGGGLHKAVRSREDEAAYLRGVLGTIMPFLLPEKYQSSRLGRTFLEELLGRVLLIQAMDLLADPDTVNLLFLLLLSRDPSPWPPHRPEPEVLLLKNFASANSHPRNSVLRSNLSSVLKDQSLLYLFHTFLKEEGAINVLQFCLAVEDFNRHILDPDLTPEQMEQLHHDALELYHTYMVASALDHIKFPTHIVAHIREIVHAEVKDIVKLRTTRPLFQAYEHAYNLLEREYLPLFMHSYTYFAHLCGTRSSQGYQKNATREVDALNKKTVGKVVVRKVGSGLRQIGKQMVLKPSVVTGGEDDHSLYDIDEADDISLLMSDEGSGSIGQAVSGLEGLTSSFRDLSAWRVSIPRVEQRVDSSSKPYYAFIVDVTRIDVSGAEHPDELHWEVERRYNEFYILENKLTEFHGEFQDNQLPPKRALFTSKDIGFMQTRRLIFEEFLQKLLQKPALKGSQLLFLFLKTKDEFTNNYLPDVSLGRLIRDVPRKLMKERGQHLDAFINVFLSSTVTASSSAPAKSKSKMDWEESTVDGKQIEGTKMPKQLLNTLFKDNAQSLNIPAQESAPPPPAMMTVMGVFDTILYLVVRVYGLSRNALRWLMCVRAMVRNTIDAAISWFLRRKLAQALAPPRIVTLIHLIRDGLFVDPPEHRCERERRYRERELRREVVGLLSPWLQRCLFTQDLYNEGANTLVTLFQHPVLNKQLSYVLLDGVLDELFPELAVTPELSPFLSNS
ncbi:sorting nexin-14-like isoform X2 [Eriocheir sinensis]|uniref:sorting nexin-14-like isoform X2 n=1 Tax=Eriocheir sinensis TaxID=95602 RepID=UPI0021C6F3DE|nr:sorting nexin-14-like isoform X2 [Eriocheir sinensis]